VLLKGRGEKSDGGALTLPLLMFKKRFTKKGRKKYRLGGIAEGGRGEGTGSIRKGCSTLASGGEKGHHISTPLKKEEKEDSSENGKL